MNRSKKFVRTYSKNDIKYDSFLIGKLINKLMKHGKKCLATRIMYKSLEICENKLSIKGDEIINNCIKLIMPTMFLRSKRIASRVYKIPVPINESMSQSIATKWMIDALKLRSERGVVEKLSAEILDIMNNGGETLKKKERYLRVAKENEAFSHYV